MSSVSYTVRRPGTPFPVRDSGRRPARATQQAALPLTGLTPRDKGSTLSAGSRRLRRIQPRGEGRGPGGGGTRLQAGAATRRGGGRCPPPPLLRGPGPAPPRPAAPRSQPHAFLPPRASHGVSERVAIEVHTSRSSLAAQRTHRTTAGLRPGLLRHHPLRGKKTSPRSCLKPAKG